MQNPTRLYFCAKDQIVFGLQPLGTAETAGAVCEGVMAAKAPGVWEIESPTQFRNAMWLHSDPCEAPDKTNIRFLEWRLRRYLKDDRTRLQQTRSAFDPVLWIVGKDKPHYGERHPVAAAYRSCMLQALRDLKETEYLSVVAYHTGDKWMEGMLEAAKSGKTEYSHDPLFDAEPAVESGNSLKPGEAPAVSAHQPYLS